MYTLTTNNGEDLLMAKERLTLQQIVDKYPFSINDLAKLSGVQKTLIQDYKDGNRYPSAKQLKRIEDAIHRLGEELKEIILIL